MEYCYAYILYLFCALKLAEGFYKPVSHAPNEIKTITPNTIDELRTALCNKHKKSKCADDQPTKIIINKVFNFTETEGYKTELGCYHKVKPESCFENGQYELNVANLCKGLKRTNVTYDLAGKTGLMVGSNKYIVGQDGGALIGKGLLLKGVENVEIRNLQIREINPRVIFAGDAIDLRNSTNVLIDNVYLKNIGRQMLVLHFGTNTGVLVNNTVFDGKTHYSSHCNGNHYWLWLFLGTADQIAFQNNLIFNTNGRGPHLIAAKQSKSIVHFIQNRFYNISDMGLFELKDKMSSILAEGNLFHNVSEIAHVATGHVFLPLTQEEAAMCKPYLGRNCLVNTVEDSKKAISVDPKIVLEDFKKIADIVVKPMPTDASSCEKQKPSGSKKPKLSAGDKPTPPGCDKPGPSDGDKPDPSDGDKPGPSSGDKPNPSTVEEILKAILELLDSIKKLVNSITSYRKQ